MLKRFVGLLLIVAIGLAGCALLGQSGGGAVKPWDQMAPKEKSLYFLQTFNMQFRDTMAMAKRSDLTEGQKIVVREKKRILEDVKPLIGIYDAQAREGGPPLDDFESMILQLLNELVIQGAQQVSGAGEVLHG